MALGIIKGLAVGYYTSPGKLLCSQNPQFSRNGKHAQFLEN